MEIGISVIEDFGEVTASTGFTDAILTEDGLYFITTEDGQYYIKTL